MFYPTVLTFNQLCVGVLWCILLLLPNATLWAQKGKAPNPCEPLYDLFENADSPDSPFSADPLNQTELVIAFYTKRNCTPAWYSPADSFALYNRLRTLLPQQTYMPVSLHTERIDLLLTEAETIYMPVGLFDFAEASPLDIYLTDAALSYAVELCQNIAGADLIQLPFMLNSALVKKQPDVFFNNLKNGLWKPETAKTAFVNEPALPDIKPIVQTVNDSALFKLVSSLTSSTNKTKTLLGETVYMPDLITDFYRRNGFTLIWLTKGSPNLTNINWLVNSINAANAEGLAPQNYHASSLNALKNTLGGSPLSDIYRWELLLTDATLRYAHHLNAGQLNPATVGFKWDVSRDNFSLPALLHDAIQKNTLSTFFDRLKPQHPQYNLLKYALADYRQKQQQGWQWEPIPDGTGSLKPGMKDDRVPLMRARLAEEYFMPPPQNNDLRPLPDSLKAKNPTAPPDSFYNEKVYDAQLAQVVKLFQKHHGLEPDGVAGRQTIAIMNETITDRINQIMINLEQWRWLPNYLGDQYLLVNVPAYLLRVYENGYAKLTKRVCTGAPSTPTPIFSEQMQYLDFNPTWGVPYSIATKEILPKLKRNPGYLDSHNMELYAGDKKVSPYKVNWGSVSARNFYYTIRQKPGSNNALGLVKFLFPNQYDVYLHDTPSKSLFANAQRAYSHGCIRLENPVELAEYLLKPEYSPARIADIINKGKNRRVFLPLPLPIYILYFTVWVDDNGNEIYFYPDVYGRDKTLLKAY